MLVLLWKAEIVEAGMSSPMPEWSEVAPARSETPRPLTTVEGWIPPSAFRVVDEPIWLPICKRSLREIS